VTGKEPQGYEYISRFFDAAMDKMAANLEGILNGSRL
jgi:hypothetical protein